jgi:hypothetical protein
MGEPRRRPQLFRRRISNPTRSAWRRVTPISFRVRPDGGRYALRLRMTPIHPPASSVTQEETPVVTPGRVGFSFIPNQHDGGIGRSGGCA